MEISLSTSEKNDCQHYINPEESDTEMLLPPGMIKLEHFDDAHFEKSFTDNSNFSELSPSPKNIKLEPADDINYEETTSQNSDLLNTGSLNTKEEFSFFSTTEEIIDCETYGSIDIHPIIIKVEGRDQLDDEGQCEVDCNSEKSNTSEKSNETGENVNDDANSEDSFHLTWDEDMLEGSTASSEDSDTQNEDLEVLEEDKRNHKFGDTKKAKEIIYEKVVSESTPAGKRCVRRKKKSVWIHRKKNKSYCFKCTYCSRSFHTQEHLDAHMNIHKETVLVCAYCNFCTATSFSINYHVKHDHNLNSCKINVDYFRKKQADVEQLNKAEDKFDEKLSVCSSEIKIKSEVCLLPPDIKRESFTNDCLDYKKLVLQELNSSKCNEREIVENSSLGMFSSFFEQLLNQNFKKNADKGELRCCFCPCIFDTVLYLKGHMFKNHLVAELFDCKICEFSGYFPVIFHPLVKSKHICNEFLNEKSKPRTRSVSKPFESNLHTNQKMSAINKFRCGLCDFSPVSTKSIISHMSAKHCPLKPFQCKKCDLTMYYPLVILEKAELFHRCEHIVNFNNNSENICSKTSDDAKNVRIANTKCKLCSFSTNSEVEFLAHMRTSHSKKPTKNYCCKKCGFSRKVTAKRWNYLKSHHACVNRKDRRHVQTLQRQLKKFVRSKIKKNDKNIETMPKENVELKCALCDYVTMSRRDLQIHKWTHKKKNFVSCTYCSFSSYGVTSMRKHLKNYHNEGLLEVTDLMNSSREPGIDKKGEKMSSTSKVKANSEGLNYSEVTDDDEATETASEAEELPYSKTYEQEFTYQLGKNDVHNDHNYFLTLAKDRTRVQTKASILISHYQEKSDTQKKPTNFNSGIEKNIEIEKGKCSSSSVIQEKLESRKAIQNQSFTPDKKNTTIKKKRGSTLRKVLKDKLKKKPYSFVSGINDSALPTISFTEEAPSPGGNQHLKDAWDELTFDYSENDFNDPQEDPLAIKEDCHVDQISKNPKRIRWKRKKSLYIPDDLDIPEDYKLRTELYGCQVCEKLYYNKMEFTMHMEQHDELFPINDREDGVFECAFCDFIGNSEPSLRWHKFKNHPTSVSYFSCCPFCSYIVRSNQLVSNHICEDHSCGPVFECSLCEHKYTRVMISHHHRALKGLSDNDPYCCEICRDISQTRDEFLLHVFYKHRNHG